MPTKPLKILAIELLIASILFTFSYCGYYGYQKYSQNYASAFPSPKETPEYAFVKLFLPIVKASKPSFSNSEKVHLEYKYGIKVQGDEYPYYKNYIFKDTCPFNFNSTLNQRPNVIIFFAESLSARFLTPYGSDFDSLTPNIDLYARSSMRIDNYYNHTIPTLNGLVGQLASVYPCFTNEDFENKDQNFKIRSLVHILNDKGYRSSAICYENKGFTLYGTMKHLGFQERWFKQDIENKLNFKSSRNDYLSDKDIFKFYIDYLNTQHIKSPFIHVVSTIDTHAGYELPSGITPYRKVKNNYLNAVKNFDAQWGLFWRWFQSSELKNNTIVILTADHCLPYTSDNAILFKENDQANPMFDKIPLIIYSPVHSFPSDTNIHSSSISFAPTILHLLNINNVDNSFVGSSLFDSPAGEHILGIYSDQVFSKTVLCNHISANSDSLISKWLLLNRYVFESNKLYP